MARPGKTKAHSSADPVHMNGPGKFQFLRTSEMARGTLVPYLCFLSNPGESPHLLFFLVLLFSVTYTFYLFGGISGVVFWWFWFWFWGQGFCVALAVLELLIL